MQQPIQATPALRISRLKHPIDLENFPLLGETDEGQVERNLDKYSVTIDKLGG